MKIILLSYINQYFDILQVAKKKSNKNLSNLYNELNPVTLHE